MDWDRLAPWLPVLGTALVAVLIALIVHRLGRTLLRRVLRFSPLLMAMLGRIDQPARYLLPLLALQLVWQGAPNELPAMSSVRHVNGVILIAALTWLLMNAVRGVAEGVIALNPANVADNLHARRIQTQTKVLARIGMGGVLVAGLAFMLLTIPGARQVGASLLASAGIAGVVAGIAARPVFGNLIAGLQIALSQPIRIDDVLVVEGEWGRVEEITGAYVILKIWDERRLVIPLQYFVEKPFQNWTRSSSQIIGTVFLRVDYRTPLQPLRDAAQRACEASPDWDKRLCLLQVTDVDSERGMQLRLLVTSASSGQNWDLRCAVREAMIDFLQREYPQCLPRMRAELGGDLHFGEDVTGAQAPTPAPPTQPDRAGAHASPDRAVPSAEREPGGPRP
jgi:small-conductance mechanosensitive channel